MSNKLFNSFRVFEEKEDHQKVIESVSRDIPFIGTKLWILIFAILLASLGLNVNSTAVIIGAMLISPLMGPIIGMGLGVGIHNFGMVRSSIFNFLFAIAVSLVASTAYFLVTPIKEGHSEILARTSPNIFDVLIAFFGGLAGILATASRFKGNVIAGMAIATALMPPLCTAGYGLATLNWNYFFGALYLFIINSVFIALATFITVRLLKFPYLHLPDPKAEKRANRIIWIIVLFTLIPSVYFGYDIVENNKFIKRANRFIEIEGKLPNDYLLQKNIDADNKKITLTYGGKPITNEEIIKLKSELKDYDLGDATLLIQQGFSFLNDVNDKATVDQLTATFELKSRELEDLKRKADSLVQVKILSTQVYKELKVQYPGLANAVFSPMEIQNDTLQKHPYFVWLDFKEKISKQDQTKIVKWLSVRLNRDSLILKVE